MASQPKQWPIDPTTPAPPQAKCCPTMNDLWVKGVALYRNIHADGIVSDSSSDEEILEWLD